MLNVSHWEDALGEVSVTIKQQGLCSPDDDSIVELPVAWIRMHSLSQKNNAITGSFHQGGNSPDRQIKKFPAARPCP